MIPLFVGLVGLYLVSSWSIDARLAFPIQNTEVYYFGLMLLLLALQMPLMLEIYRRRTKQFMMRRVVLAFLSVASVLVIVAYNIAPKIDPSKLEAVEKKGWDSYYDLDDDGENDNSDDDE